GGSPRPVQAGSGASAPPRSFSSTARRRHLTARIARIVMQVTASLYACLPRRTPTKGGNGRDELGRDRRRRAERGVVEHQVLVDGAAGRLGRQPLLAWHAALAVGVGRNQAGRSEERR